ncbi:MAG: VPS10 domain-containing protein [Terriglobales bacterium]
MRKESYFLAAVAVLALVIRVPNAVAASVPATALTRALRWRNVGPYVGGRVTSVAGVAQNPNLYYMATAGGGVWETKNAGHNWRNISDKYFKTGNIGAIAVSPSNPSIIYVGTGDSAPRNTVLTTGGDNGGMYKTTDGGQTWTQIGLEQTHSISWIVVDPSNPDVVYVAALGHIFAPNPARGVYKTTDGGQTWQKILYVNDYTGAVTLAMDPQNPQVLYATMWQFYRRPWTLSSGGPGSGLYKTTDGGAHWTNLSQNPGLPSGIWGNVGVALAPSEPNVVYVLIQANYKPGLPGGLFRSDNGGQSWQLMSDSLDITQRAYYYMRVYVDPTDANTIYLPNVGVYASHDAGKSLIALHPPHGDNHAFWINPNHPNDLIEGNDGGATVSLNGGKTWSTEHNQPTGQVYHANLDNQFPFHIYGAQQDEDSSEGPSAVPAGAIPAVWTSVRGGEECWVVPVPDQPWITYTCDEFSVNTKFNRRTGEDDNVSPWPADKNGSAGYEIKYRYGWNHHAAATSPDNPNEFLLGANVLFKTLDGGVDWQVISPDLTRNDKSKQVRSGGPISKDQTGEEMYDTISAIRVSPLNGQIIWVGSDDGLVHVTSDGGAHWSNVTPPGLPAWAVITSVEPSHVAKGAAYVSASRYMMDDFHPYVYKTSDFGQHWIPITHGLPSDEYINSVRQDPSDPNLLLAGSSLSVYFSEDGGSHWMPLRLNLPPVRVNDIEFQPEQHAVVLATFGRAYWVLDNLQFLEQLGRANVSSTAPYLFQPQQTWLVKRRTFSFGGRGSGGTNLAPGATVFFYLPSSYSRGNPVKLSFTTAAGKLIRRFSLPQAPPVRHSAFRAAARRPPSLHPGVNRFQWDLRYPDAVDVNGVLWSENGASEPVGPQVVPGTYYVLLSDAGNTQKQPFIVKLDPRLSASQAALRQRFDLMVRIDHALDQLDTLLDQSLHVQTELQKAIAANRVSGQAAQLAESNLSQNIDSLVNLKIQSSEGGLMFRARLHAWLTNIDQHVDGQYEAPTPGMVRVANMYMQQAREGVAHLKAALAAAQAALKG